VHQIRSLSLATSAETLRYQRSPETAALEVNSMKIKRRFRRITRSTLLRNVLALFSARAASQVILLLSAPLIARLFTPSDYGTAALLLALTFLLAPLATLGYGMAAQLAESDTDARSLLRLTMVTTALFAILITASIGIAVHNFESAFLLQFGAWVWMIPILFVLEGIESLFASWNTRKKQFKIQASTMVAGVTVGTGSRITFGLTGGSSVGGLVLGYIIGLVSRTAILARSSGLSDLLKGTRHPFGHYKDLIIQYRDFPLYNTPTTLLKFLAKKLPLLFFGALFSPAAAGFYAMADRLFFHPLNLLQVSFRSVFLQHLVSARKEERRLAPTLLKGCIFTGVSMLPPSLLLMLYGETGAVWLLGEKWGMAGVFLEITAPLMIFASMVVPAGAAMVVCRQQRRLLVQEVATTVMLVLGFMLSYLVWKTPEAAVQTMVVILAARHSYMIGTAFMVVRTVDRNGRRETENGSQ
jgi:O-antigen/teichoic acid export membrane protein